MKAIIELHALNYLHTKTILSEHFFSQVEIFQSQPHTHHADKEDDDES